METTSNITGQRMRQLRIERRMTQEEVGKLLGVSKATINKYELGTTKNLSLSKIKTLADFFEVSPTYLLGLDKEQDASAVNKIQPVTGVLLQHKAPKDSSTRMRVLVRKSPLPADRQEKELLAVFRSLSVRGQNRLLFHAYELQDKEQNNKKHSELPASVEASDDLAEGISKFSVDEIADLINQAMKKEN